MVLNYTDSLPAWRLKLFAKLHRYELALLRSMTDRNELALSNTRYSYEHNRAAASECTLSQARAKPAFKMYCIASRCFRVYFALDKYKI